MISQPKGNRSATRMPAVSITHGESRAANMNARARQIFLPAFLSVFAAVCTANAQSPAVDTAALRSQFRAPAPGAVQQRWGELAAATTALDSWLIRTNPQGTVGWRNYLHWNDLLQGLQAGPAADPEPLREV